MSQLRQSQLQQQQQRNSNKRRTQHNASATSLAASNKMPRRHRPWGFSLLDDDEDDGTNTQNKSQVSSQKVRRLFPSTNTANNSTAAAAAAATTATRTSSSRRRQEEILQGNQGAAATAAATAINGTMTQGALTATATSATTTTTTTTNSRSPAAASMRSRFSRATTTTNTAAAKTSSMDRHRNRNPSSSSSSSHIICAVIENRAKQTCVAALDVNAPTHSFQALQQTNNGQTYAETMACLAVLQPHEILLNQGRQHSPLVRKIVAAYANNNQNGSSSSHDKENEQHATTTTAAAAASSSHSSHHTTVVQFVSRACFDQTRGAEVLRKVLQPATYDATSLVQDYTLLSACHAVLLYAQTACLGGASFAKHSLHLTILAGSGVSSNSSSDSSSSSSSSLMTRMHMDRTTLQQLELLLNIRTGKVANSLVGTMDCTRTTVGSRLLRTNFMAPPCKVATITTRQELVDLFLANHDDFFFAVLEHLEALPDVDKMLASLAIVPPETAAVSTSKTKKSNANSAMHQRLASRGISALVCLKSTLSALPSLAGVLEQHLQFLDHQEEGDRPQTGMTMDRRQQQQEAQATPHTVRTDRSSLLVGLGAAASPADVVASSNCRFQLLRAIHCALIQPSLQTVLQAVCKIFTETTTFHRNVHAMRHQECFALKCDESDLMTIIRKAFLSNVDDIYQKADEYAEVHGIPVHVRHSTTRGYYLAVPADVGVNLPSIFLHPAKSGRSITCTTEEIASLNSRAADNMHDLLLMTHDRIQKVLNVAREHYDVMATMCDAVALLDLCHSFADRVTISQNTWCRPVVFEASSLQSGAPMNDETASATGSRASEADGALMIRKGRFAIEDVLEKSEDGPTEFIPNDTYVPHGKPFTVITGINGSGKSTYLKQVALIVILAQCGSYVPAEQAAIPVRDHIFCRLGNADDQEHNLSTFLLEMKETAFICNHATEGSLVLVDELGRATSNEDGVAIAWSTSEYLLKKRSMTLFVTHYPQLTRLSDTYPRLVQNVHLTAKVTQGSAGDICYTYQLKNGACNVSSEYGVELAAACGWPQDAFQAASTLQSHVEGALPDERLCDTRPDEEDAELADQALSLLEQTFHNLQLIASSDDLPPGEKRQLLCELQDRFLECVQDAENSRGLQKAIKGLLHDEETQPPATQQHHSHISDPSSKYARRRGDEMVQDLENDEDDEDSSLSSSSSSSSSSDDSSSSSSEEITSDEEDDDNDENQMN